MKGDRALPVIYIPGLVTAMAIALYIGVNQIGPRWFWASDLCPEPNVGCGIIPVGVIVASIAGVIVASISRRLVLRLGWIER